MNAKELILDKINCGDNLAKCHLYLIMLGFDIKDVVSFMISPCVSLINNLSEANMMDSYIDELKVDDAIKIAKGEINPNNFIFGTVYDLESGKNVSNLKVILGLLKNNLKVLLDKETHPKFNSFTDLIKLYINARLTNKHELKELSFYYKYGNKLNKEQLSRLSDYIEKVIYQLKLHIDSYNLDSFEENFKEFNNDLNEFEKIYKLANETSTLGGTFLGLNQGLPSDKASLMDHIRKIKKAIIVRENEFDLYQNKFISKNPDEDKNFELTELLNKIKANNEFIDLDKALDIIKKVHAFNILGNFNFEDWLYDKQLTEKDIINKTFIDENVEIQGIYSYKELISDYYNLIKGTWNIFDIINKIPQYKAIFKLYKSVYTIDKYTSIRSYLINDIYDKVFKKFNYVDEKLTKKISDYVNELLIVSFFRDNAFKFPIYAEQEYFDIGYNSLKTNKNMMLNLETSSGRASFKKNMESLMIQLSLTGKYGEIFIENYKNNKFLQDLQITYDNNIPVLSLKLDMMNINSTPNSQKIFQEYLNGLRDLQNVNINGLSLTDWIILYNLFTNKNMYGSDRLTTIFKNSIINKNSILQKYFNYISNIDYNEYTSEVLLNLEYNIDDLYYRLAPYVNQYEKMFISYPYIRTKNELNEYVIEKYDYFNRKYKEVSTFPKGLNNRNDITDDLKFNYSQYQSIKMLNLDFNISLREGLTSTNVEDLLNSLIIYSSKGILNINIENC